MKLGSREIDTDYCWSEFWDTGNDKVWWIFVSQRVGCYEGRCRWGMVNLWKRDEDEYEVAQHENITCRVSSDHLMLLHYQLNNRMVELDRTYNRASPTASPYSHRELSTESMTPNAKARP